MGELKIIKVEKYNRFDTTYLAVTVLDDGRERTENFAGDEWLQLDENGQEKFVAKVIQNKKDSDRGNLVPIEKVKQKFEGKVLSLE